MEVYSRYVVLPAKATDCWGWTGYIMWAGYATFTSGTKSHRAHRFAYERFVGPIPPKFDIDHLCRNRSCTNPDHLEAVDHRTNVLRGISPSAVRHRKTVCIKGHPLSPENTRVQGDGRRQCVICDRRRQREAYRRRVARESAAILACQR